jgi:hypothetical protein
VHKTLSAPESPYSLCNVTDREWGGSGTAHAIKTWIPAVSYHVGNITLRIFPKPLWPLEIAPIILVHAVLCDEYKLWSSPLCSFLLSPHPSKVPVLSPKIWA